MSCKKKNFIIVIIFIISSLFFIFPFLKLKMILIGGDLPYHINRIQELTDNLRSGNWYPYLYTYHFNKTGYLLGAFYPQLTLLPFAFFSMILGSYVKGIYLGLSMYTLLAMIIFYVVMRKLHRSQLESLFASIIYCFCAYRSIDAYSRFALGEFLGMVFIPLALYGLYAILIGNKNDWPYLAIGLSFTLLSHVLSSFLCVCTLVIIFLICLPHIKNTKARIKALFFSIFAFLGSSAIFLFPFLEQEMSNKYKQPSPFYLPDFTSSLSSLILNSISNNLNSTVVQHWWDIANIGFILIIALTWGIFTYKNQSTLNKGLLIFGGVFFLVSSGLFPWTVAAKTPLHVIQFPFRLLEISTIFLVPIAASLCTDIINDVRNKSSKYFVFFLLIAAIVFPWYSSVQNFIGSFYNNSENYSDGKLYTNPKVKEYWWLDQYTPTMSKKDFNNIYNHRAMIGNHRRTITHISAIPNGLVYRDYQLRNKKNVTLPVAYYKNMQVYQSGKINRSIRNKGNLVNLRKTTKGTISVVYVPSTLDRVSQIVSILTWLLLLYLLIRARHANKKALYVHS